ncbi:P-loop containing nucleoside triphosphate hydrolase protein [Ochromonadaceae sp. CCMP2298]|nr:P-loop containing nucleoside triphosphate hydrolase protein [Ochromonadaceae sp. CCMP2298]
MLNEGIMVTMTQNLDVEVARRVTIAFGKPLAGDDDDEEDDDEDEPELLPRAPVVTIMGHVDHGKTTLLDRIRSAQVAQAEAGGITQAISAFKVVTPNDNTVTFFDTPGHSAFSEMRQRGANVTDVVVLVVAADDGVMDQTKECIAAAKAAGCPIVVAINKMDKEGADPSRVKTELMSYDVLLEEFGGECQCVEISAKTGSGIDELLEKILLQSDVLNLKAVVDAPAAGSVIEARVDKGLGVVVTALVQKGTLSVGDLVLAGPSWGRVRRLVNDQGIQVQSVGPSTPVQIVGMNGVPGAGDQLSIATSEADAKDVADARQRLNKMAVGSASKSAIMAMASGFAGGGADTREVIKIPIVIKGDVLGSVQAIRSAIEALQESDDEAVCKADIVYSSVGDVTSSDVAIAAAAKARIVAFNVASGFNAMEEARSNNVDIGYYSVIYELLEQMKTQIQTTLAPPPPGTLLGRLEIKKVFKLGRAGKVAGCEVTEGIVRMDSKVRVLRGKRNVIYSGSIASIKVVKDDVREVPIGSECGVSLTDYSDFEEGDILECFSIGQTDA